MIIGFIKGNKLTP